MLHFWIILKHIFTTNEPDFTPVSPSFSPRFNPDFQLKSARATKISDLCALTAKNNFLEMQIWLDILERTLANSHMFVTYAKEDFQFLQI